MSVMTTNISTACKICGSEATLVPKRVYGNGYIDDVNLRNGSEAPPEEFWCKSYICINCEDHLTLNDDTALAAFKLLLAVSERHGDIFHWKNVVNNPNSFTVTGRSMSDYDGPVQETTELIDFLVSFIIAASS